jgi:hypothetical protein
MRKFETQLEFWTKTPLVTNTEPDFSWVGNSDLLDRTIRTHNWIRTDTILIENTQIEALSNRPAWTAAICEVGITTGDPKRVGLDQGVTYNEKITSHVLDVGANYCPRTGTTRPPTTFSVTTRNIRNPSTTSRGTSDTECLRRSSGVSRESERQDSCLVSPTKVSLACRVCCALHCSATMAKST